MSLGRDIFSFIGLGCRNVTKLYIPDSYNLSTLLDVMNEFSHLSRHNKYMNNVEYYRTIYLMNRNPFLDNGILLLKEDPSIASPVGVVHYERYSEIGKAVQEIDLHRQEIQCIVSISPVAQDTLIPGETQMPQLWDYADGVNTLDFLIELG